MTHNDCLSRMYVLLAKEKQRLLAFLCDDCVLCELKKNNIKKIVRSFCVSSVHACVQEMGGLNVKKRIKTQPRHYKRKRVV